MTTDSPQLSRKDTIITNTLKQELGEDTGISWSEMTPKERVQKVATVLILLGVVGGLLYFFLVALDLMGGSFKVLGGKDAATMFDGISNPVTGLMVGIFATVLVQSSSTTTSIVVGLVGSDLMSVKTAIPIIMGANVGTSVTNTLVSLVHSKNPEEFKKAFGGATVHDFFNLLSCLILLPLEAATGMLQELSSALTDLLTGSEGGEYDSPIKEWVEPTVLAILEVDKSKIKGFSKGTKYNDSSLVIGGVFYDDTSLDDDGIGTITLIMSAIMLLFTLISLVKVLSYLLRGTAVKWLRKALEMSAIISMIIGGGITALVQSSSITTSTLVPLVGIGAITLEQMFPLTLGANVGTTVTALLAAISTGSSNAMQIALAHLCFNIIGIIIWYPIPQMRAVPIWLARNLGFEVKKRKWVAVAYTAWCFFLLPLMFLGFSAAGDVALGVGAFFIILGNIAFFAYIWVYRHKRELIPPWMLQFHIALDASAGNAASQNDKEVEMALKSESIEVDIA